MPHAGLRSAVHAAVIVIAGLSGTGSAAEIEIVEFYNTTLNHYLVTNPVEAAMIDAGSAGAGWIRTGYFFKGTDVAAEGYQPTCRFYTTGANSHFYTAEASECDYLKSLNPSNFLGDDYWTYEGTSFYAMTAVDGICPMGTQPVYRLYNDRAAEGDSNHRFTTDSDIYEQMEAEDWIPEGVAMCSPVTGNDMNVGPTIIWTNTTWHTGDRISMTGEVQIAPGATLTIKPGVVITGNDNRFYVAGNLVMAGDAANPILVNSARFNFGADVNTPGFIDFRHVEMNRGAFLPATGNGSHGYFEVRDSQFIEVDGFYIWYPSGPSSFERNIFEASEGLSIGTSGNGSVVIKNNVFVSQSTPYAVENWANYNDGLTVTHNSFLTTGSVALALPEGYTNSGMAATNNYFGTTNTVTIDAMILDRSDSLARASIIEYVPFLTEPDPSTPSYD